MRSRPEDSGRLPGRRLIRVGRLPRRMSLLVLILSLAVLTVAALVIGILYRTALHQEADLLSGIVQSQARTIEGIARHEQQYAELASASHGDPFTSAIGQLRDINTRFRGFGRTGEFTLARRENDSIVFLMSQRNPGKGRTQVLPFDGASAEPMRRALLGKSGTLIGPDYRGRTVLAAFEPVSAFGMGIVAKVDLAEIQAPFVHAGLISILAAFAVVLLGSLLFYRTTNPVLRRLEDSEAALNLAEALSHVGSWTLELARNELKWSDEVYRIFGFRPQEFGATYQAFLSAVHPDDRAAVDSAYSESVRNAREGYEIEHRVVRKDSGGIRIVREKCRHVRDASGRVIRSIGMVHDVTESRTAEVKIRRLAEQRQLALDAARLGWWQYDPATRTARWDEGYRAIVGVTGYSGPNDEILQHVIHPNDLPELRARIEAALNPADPQPFAIECRIRRASDGLIRWVEAHGTATFEGSGDSRRAVSFVGTVQDVTERRRAEETLRLSEDRFAKTFARSAAAMSLVRLNDGIYLEVNDAWVRVFGHSRAYVVGKTSTQLELWLDAGERDAMYRALRQTDSIRETEYRMRCASGQECVVLTSAEVITLAGEQVILTSALDITARKRAEEENARQLDELQRWQAVMIGREDRNMELKREVNELLLRLGEPIRYPSQAKENGEQS